MVRKSLESARQVSKNSMMGSIFQRAKFYSGIQVLDEKKKHAKSSKI